MKIILVILTVISYVHSESITICDCSNPNNRGLLDMAQPLYCKTAKNKNNVMTSKDELKYQIVTKSFPEMTWHAYSCTKWIRTKKITGSFWIGAFNTEYFQNTKEVEPQECKRMIGTKQCGGNMMVTKGGIYTFDHAPTGEGRWYSTKEYTTMNCMVQKITLRQEKPGDKIESPFGYLNVDLMDGHDHINHNTIVWQLPSRKSNTINCGEIPQLYKGWEEDK